jgi:biopolymer transport protein TolR
MAFFSPRKQKRIAEINVTPLVDVMLVLLVIFMITAPMFKEGIQLELPRVKAQAVTMEKDHLSVYIDAQGRVYLEKTLLDLNNLQPLQQAIQAHPNLPILVEADRRVDYGRVALVLATLHQGGATRINLLTEPPPRKP